MFNTEMLLRMAGISQESMQQLMAVKAHLDRLPQEKQREIVGKFVQELQDAVKELEVK